MLMKLFHKSAKTQEEFLVDLAGRQKGFMLLLLAGAGSLAVGFFLNGRADGPQSEYLSGLYCGMGVGIIFASLLLLWKNYRTMRDAKKLREQWLKESDERNRALNEKAFFLIGAISFFVKYALFLAAGFFSMEVLTTLWGLIMFYVVGFVVIRKILERRM